MKKILLTAVITMFGLTASAKEKEKVAKKDTAEFKVGMHCQGCVNRITNELTYTTGVTDLKVNLNDKTVWVEYKPQKINADSLFSKLKSMGYTVEKK
ncbi:MAG: heavy-metal-associated domain-containing protein [Paludibacteraceae bacterium]|nr:heavy-metal-associated domain-containing protein [Paludibacteraceae bacterium]